VHASYSKRPIVRLATKAQNDFTLRFGVNGMHSLTIVADDSPLQQTAQPAFLSEYGWETCDDVWDARSEMAVIDFPASNASPQPRQRPNGRPPFVVIKVDKRSRLLSYESHFVAGNQPEIAPRIKAAVAHVLPPENRPKAESLCFELSQVENQDQQFYEAEEPDAVCVAAHNYRQRRRQDILAELIELKNYGSNQ
jgi:hypothetical protein